jgi:hypothetical protein
MGFIGLGPMRYPIAALPFYSMAVACTAVDAASVEDRTLSFGCEDIMVVGRVKNSGFSPVRHNDDIIGHGSASAAILVRKAVRGPKLPRVIPVHYFAHAYMREDRDFMFVLRRSEGGTFGVASAQLMSLKPRLAAQCR